MDYQNSNLKIIQYFEQKGIPTIDSLVKKVNQSIKGDWFLIQYQNTKDKLLYYLRLIQDIYQQLADIKSQGPKESQCQKEVNHYLLNNCLTYMKRVYFDQLVNNFRDMDFDQIVFIKKLLISSHQLNFLMKILNQAMFFTKDDLLGIPKEQRENSNRWKKIQGNFYEIQHQEKAAINSWIEQFNKLLFSLKAAFILSQENALYFQNIEDFRCLYKGREKKYAKLNSLPNPTSLMVTKVCKKFVQYKMSKDVIQKGLIYGRGKTFQCISM